MQYSTIKWTTLPHVPSWLLFPLKLKSNPCPGFLQLWLGQNIQIESYILLPKVCRKFTINFSSKFKPQFQVIFGQDSFPMNTSPFQTSLSQNSPNCLLTNGRWNACFYHYSFTLPLPLSLLGRAWFVVRCFFFIKQIILVVFPDFFRKSSTKSPIFFFMRIQVAVFEYFQSDVIFDILE